MFDVFKIRKLYTKCFPWPISSFGIDEKVWVKNLVKAGWSYSDIVTLLLLEDKFFALTDHKESFLNTIKDRSGMPLSDFGIEALLRLKEKPSLFTELYKFRDHAFKYNVSYSGRSFREFYNQKSWDKEVKIAQATLDELQVIYDDRVFYQGK